MNNVTRTTFNGIKELASHGLSNNQIAKLDNFSTATISRVKAQDTWDDYIVWKKETREKLAAAKEAKEQRAVDSLFPNLQESLDQLTIRPKVTSLEPLNVIDGTNIRIAIALERIVDVLEKRLEHSKKSWRL